MGGIPGVTKRVEVTKVHNEPDVYMFDTPGIFIPSIQDPEVGLKMALCGRSMFTNHLLFDDVVGSVKDSVVGEGEIADYLLFTLNQTNNFRYVEEIGLEEPTDEITDVLNTISRRSGKDELSAARLFIRKYREGKFGMFLLDTLHSHV